LKVYVGFCRNQPKRRPNAEVDGFDFLQLIPFLDSLFPAYLFCPILEIDSFRGEWADRLVPPFQHAI